MNFRDRVVDDWRDFHKWASMRFAALAVLAQAIVEQYPTMPVMFRDLLPLWVAKAVAWIALGLVFVGRLHKQPDKK